MIGFNGDSFKEFGKTIFEVQLGQENFKEIIVAEIKDDTLLGLDVLMQKENGPVDIRLHENLITFRWKTIEFHQTTEKLRKVLAADNFIIPVYCENIFDVFTDRYEDDQELTHNVFCGSLSEGFNNRNSLLQTSCSTKLKDQVSTR